MATNYLDLINFTNRGIVVADYNKIRQVLTARFKAIYGSDIDLSSTSADGQWIEEQCLFINNMLQTIKQLYSSIDPRYATGEYLDIIASLTNVTRLPATKSTAYVTIKGLTPNTEYTIQNPLVLLDRNGNTWVCSPFTTDSNGEATVLTTCDVYGPIRAEVGWIYTTIEALGGVTITMSDAAIPGRGIESDSQLRARRSNSLSTKGVTVMESIISSLLNINGILDAAIYNNDTGSVLLAKDGTNIPISSIYILIRKNINIPIDDSIIGSLIYEKKTPGILTTTPGVDNKKSYLYPTQIQDLTQKVEWKECKPIAPEIIITLNPKSYFVSSTDETGTGKIVGNKIINFLNNLRISQNINHIELLSEVLYADPMYRGTLTYSIESVTINGVAGDYINPDTYFNYTSAVYNPTDKTITIN